MRIFVDIETIPDQTPGALDAIRATVKPPANYSKADTIAKWMAENGEAEAERAWRKTALSGTSGEVVCVGFAVGDDGEIESLHRSPGESEADLLRAFWRRVGGLVLDEHHHHAAGVEWCGHNVAFDLRFLKQRSTVHRIMPTLKTNPDARHGAGHVFRTMAEWAGVRDTISLDALCKALGVESPKAGGFDGSQVYDAWIAGKAGEVAEYCKKDVEAARQCYRRLAFAAPPPPPDDRRASASPAKPAATNSRAKGAAAERELAKRVEQELGVKLARNLEQSRSGGHDLEPVGESATAEALRRFAIECKRHTAITPAKLADFWRQAEEQATKAGRVPALAYRADRQDWRICVPLSAVNNTVFGEWGGVAWAAEMSVPAFCALVREGA